MAETLFITPDEIISTTIMGGNVDPDRYVMNIAFVQVTVIEPMLGTELYDKIIEDFENDELEGDYLTLFNNFVKPITKNQAVGEYIEVSSFLVENGGTFKHSADNREQPTRKEIDLLAGKYKGMAEMYVSRFEKWICNNSISEYKHYQDEVNAQKTQTIGGLFFSDKYASPTITEYNPPTDEFAYTLNSDLS